MQTSPNFYYHGKCSRPSCKSCVLTKGFCPLNTNDPNNGKKSRSRSGIRKVRLVYTIAVSMMLTGCAHSTWSSLRSSTEIAAWMNPVAFALNVAGTIGEYATRSSTENVDSKDVEEKKTEQTEL